MPLLFKAHHMSLTEMYEGPALSFFFQLFPDEFWKIMVDAVNMHLCTLQGSPSNPVKATNKAELVRFYGIILSTSHLFAFSFFTLGLILLLENTFGNDVRSLSKHYKSLKKDYGPFTGLGFRRFSMLRTSFRPSLAQISQISQILRTSIHRY